jgi:hypothetical protein
MIYEGFTLLTDTTSSAEAELSPHQGDEECIGFWTIRVPRIPAHIYIESNRPDGSSSVAITGPSTTHSEYYLPLISRSPESDSSASMAIPLGTSSRDLGVAGRSPNVPYTIDVTTGSVVRHQESVKFAATNHSRDWVSVIVFSADGRQIAEIGRIPPGADGVEIVWHPDETVASGIYFAAIDGSNRRFVSKKVVLID